MSGRYIIDNIRLIFDILGYSDLVQDESCILFLDFCKASDKLHENA